MSEPSDTKLDFEGNVNFWAKKWNVGDIGFHRSKVSATLIENLPKLTSDGRSKKVFIPLCGKSLDILYLLQEGHQVLGVEVVAKAIEDLSTENNLALKFNQAESIYHTEDGKLQIFCGDLFSDGFQKFVHKTGPMDLIWDRGSFIALEYPYRTEYVNMMKSALQLDSESQKYINFHYLLETVDYNRNDFGGPPRAVDEADMEKYFADWTSIQLVSRTAELQGRVRKVLGDEAKFDQVVYLLTSK